ncbi:hypothetical protein ACETRX_33335, partial [Labrys portucalensis]
AIDLRLRGAHPYSAVDSAGFFNDPTIDVVPAKDGPYLPINDTATTLTPSNTGNAVPIMTSDTAPFGVCSASSSVAGFGAFRAFDGDSSSFWANTNKVGWLSYQFAASKVIIGYSVQASNYLNPGDPSNNGPMNAPKSWTFEGANDGSTWIVLDSQFAQTGWSNNETRSYLFSNTTSYLYYRINIASNNAGSELDIASLRMLELPANSPAIAITASEATGINNDAGFKVSDVGRFITLLGSDSVYHPFQIVGVTSSTVITVKPTGGPLPSARGTLQWRFGAWGETPGWPAHVATFEQRKVYARTDAQPSGLWATKTGGYGRELDFSVSVPVKDDDAISFTLTDVNEIQWIAEGPDLLIGTAGSARTMGRDSPNLPFSANNFRQSLTSAYASQAIRPAKVGNSTVFVSSFGKALREFVQGDSGMGYATPDISVLSDHLFASGVAELAYAQEPDSVIWLPNGKGELIGLTYEKDQSIAGMHRHLMGGEGFVESCATMPGQGRNEVWLIVRRMIGGVSRRSIERMAAPFEAATAGPDKAWYLDCALQYGGAPATGVTGLSHLEGQRVGILADGAREADQIVTDGTVSLASGRPAETITVGLPYTSRVRLMPSPASAGDGSGLGRRKKIISARIDFLATGSLRVGQDEATAEEIVARHTSDDLGTAAPIVTGFYDARPQTSWGDKGELVLTADGPLPATIRSITLNTDPEP